ncbi:hypothetical protein FDUTEX481_04488 [Tolypothrix sp. PCC 7601]|nr:hypothetical protein FDUTEX481_04488 [Tolypothrix sp. PCC 7601]BAU04560.1 hypothetical protein FIS3754_04480 [Fischerella sp. NIES-3754]BAY95144.1 hypothetical protein NIES3275_72010 [Microchaete diplosiphon NIES-3275]
MFRRLSKSLLEILQKQTNQYILYTLVKQKVYGISLLAIEQQNAFD